jgi:glycosyltransferase involved in cell wall biosynthesis
MRVLVHAPAARMGGARAHVLGLLPELARLEPRDDYLVLAQPDLLAELPTPPSHWRLVPERAQARGSLRRLAWEQLALPRLARDWGADVLLSFGSFIPLRASCAAVLEAGNALPFTPAYWRALRNASATTRAEELARWLLLRRSLNAATRILAPTRAMRQDVAACLPKVARRIDVAAWGVAEQFHRRAWEDPDADVVLGVSKHGINKEFHVLVAALPRLLRRRPRLVLRLTGTPNESPWAQRSWTLARELGVLEHVQFVGDVPNRLVPELMAQARVIVFPTWCESFGLPLAEALAMGAPAVAANIPACREVGGEAARYYQPGDPASLEHALAELLAAEDARRQLAAAARERGRGFRWSANALGVRDSLRKALAIAAG